MIKFSRNETISRVNQVQMRISDLIFVSLNFEGKGVDMIPAEDV